MKKTIICHSNEEKFQNGFKAAIEYLKEVGVIDNYSVENQYYEIKPGIIVSKLERIEVVDESFEY